MKRFLALLLMVLCLINFLVGCGGTKQTGGDTDAGKTSNTTAKTTVEEKVFTFARSEDVAKWDPFDQNNLVNGLLYDLIYNTLVHSDRKGGFTPELATEWKTSEDGKQWTFKLRDDVKFHNGDKLTSADVKITFDRIIEDKSLIRASLFTAFEKIETPDEYTVVFYLSEPQGVFLNLLSSFPIIPGKLYKEMGTDLFKLNIGTGPWKFVEWVPGQRIVFEKNPDYWEGEVSNCDKIIYRPVSEDTTRVSGVRTGDIDMADGIPSEQADMLENEPEVIVDRVQSGDQIYVGFQFKNSIFADENARRAVDHAIDRKALTENILGGGKPASWPVAEGVMGYDPNGEVPEFNVELAKEYLKKSNYDGSPINVIGPNANYPRIIEVLQAVASMLTDVGFNVKLEMLEGAAFQERRVAGQYDLYITGCAMGNGDPGTAWTQRWVGDSLNSSYRNQELFDLVNASNVESDPVKRNELLRQAAALVKKNLAPWGFLYAQESIVIYRKGISGVIVYPDRHIDLSRVMKE